MSDDRRDPDELAGLEDLPPDDPRVRALGPGARARLHAYHDFVAPGELPEGANLAEAERLLGETLERELGVSIGHGPERPRGVPDAAGGPRRAGGSLAALLGPRLLPAFAAALLVAVAGGAWLVVSSRRGGEEPVMRGGPGSSPGVEATASVRTLGDGTLRLEWTPTPEATGYALVFLSPDLTEIARVAKVRETRFELRAGSLPPGLPSGADVLLQVVAMRGSDEITRAQTVAIRIP
jgi:hypothetical protein